MKKKFIHGEPALASSKAGNFTVHVRKRRGRWWFVGDVCREIKCPITEIMNRGGAVHALRNLCY